MDRRIDIKYRKWNDSLGLLYILISVQMGHKGIVPIVIGSVVISVLGIKKHYSKILRIALIACGCFMALMLIVVGGLMIIVTLVLGSRKSIRKIEVVNCEHELKNA